MHFPPYTQSNVAAVLAAISRGALSCKLLEDVPCSLDPVPPTRVCLLLLISGCKAMLTTVHSKATPRVFEHVRESQSCNTPRHSPQPPPQPPPAQAPMAGCAHRDPQVLARLLARLAPVTPAAAAACATSFVAGAADSAPSTSGRSATPALPPGPASRFRGWPMGVGARPGAAVLSASARRHMAVVAYQHRTQAELVTQLVAQGLVTSSRVEAALRELDRREFCATHIGIPDHVAYAVSARGRSGSGGGG